MAEVLDDGEFWLPPKFLCDEDDDVFVNKNKNESEFFGSSDFNSPVESVTETESDEEDYLAGLTRQMTHSSLNNEFTENDNVFNYNSAKGGFLSSSPQSTLCPTATACGCRGSSHDTTRHQNARSRLDFLYAAAAAADIVKMQANNAYGYGPLPHHNRGFNSLLRSQQQIQALHLQQMLKQAKARMTMMGSHMQQQQNRAQAVQNRGVGFVWPNGNADQVGLSQTAWPSNQQAKQSNRRVVFAGKRECAGTGVFLPRRVQTRTETPPRKKPTVLIPAKVVHALNLNLEEMGSQPHFQAPFNGAKLHPFYNIDGGAVRPVQRRNNWEHPVASHQEASLPREWTY